MHSPEDIRAFVPPGPTNVPPELVAPSSGFAASAWLAMLGLFAFVGVYLGLIGYCCVVLLFLFAEGRVFPAIFFALPPLFFLGFLVRGLFLVKHANDPRSVEVTAAEQPRLFAFLHHLADSTGAPRPHRVFLSAGVNAGVFYDLSFLNLLIPTEKNLDLGLGLVEALSLDELKAVVAHEFGHFAQKTMAVGRWVYVAQQIAGHVVMSRSNFDRALRYLSSMDLRIAWIGWLMRLFVWAIRAVLDTFLLLAMMAHRALGRQMEFQADRVAVSVTGSDSLIHALHRLGSADEAFHEAMTFAAEETAFGRPVEDLFALEAAAIEHLRRVLDDPHFGATPNAPERGTPGYRVFAKELASPPKMWATHPPNRDREEHAKAIYLPSTIDPRSSWSLFVDPLSVRRKVTRALFTPAPGDAAAKPLPPPVPIAESLAKFDETMRRASLDPRYRGVYLDRPVAGFHKSPSTMVGGTGEAASREAVLGAFEYLYPESIREMMSRYREAMDEERLLEGLSLGILSAPGGMIVHRGREIRRGELPSVIERVRDERRTIEQALVDHDGRCRMVHREIARQLGRGWDHYLSGLVHLLHFATHVGRSVADSHSHLHHVLAIVLADGNVSDTEMNRLVSAANDLQTELEIAWDAKRSLRIPWAVEQRFQKRGGFTVLKGNLGIGRPDIHSVGQWLEFVDGYAGDASMDYSILADAALDTLLEVEDYLAAHYVNGTDPGDAPDAGAVPGRYSICTVGGERERQKRLDWWDRFQTADGLVPGILRFALALVILVPGLVWGAAYAFQY